MSTVNRENRSGPVRKGYVDTSGGQIHYRTVRPAQESAPPLVLLHQTASASAMYEGLLGALTGRWLLALDTPGFGGSFTPEQPLTISYCAAMLAEALASLGITECDVFGHHTGAALAVQLAHAQLGLVRRLVLSGPPLLNPEQVAALKASLRPFTLAPDGSHLTAIWARLRGRDPDLPLAVVHRETLLTAAAGEQAQQAYQAVFTQDFAGQLQALTQPVLMLAGEYDTLRASLEPALALLRNGQGRVLPAATTYVCDREPARLAGIIAEFLAAASDQT